MINSGKVCFEEVGRDGIAPSRALENMPARKPFSHARCSREKGALSGIKGTAVVPESGSAAVPACTTPNLLTTNCLEQGRRHRGEEQFSKTMNEIHRREIGADRPICFHSNCVRSIAAKC